MKLRIDEIKIRKRIRQDDGDLNGLMDSIKAHGLINPVTVTDKKVLIAGFRRIMACKALGIEDIECRVIPSGSKLDRLRMEADENILRKDFTAGEELRLQEEMDYLSARGWRKFLLWLKRIIAALKAFLSRMLSRSR